MKKRTNLLKFLALAFAAVLIIAGCANPEEQTTGDVDAVDTVAPAESDSDTLLIGVSNNIDSLNPFQRTGTVSTYVQRFFYETLLDMVGPTDFKPRLGAIETDDNQVFTVSLNPDANWSDGEPVTAQDVVYSAVTTAHPDTITSQASNIAMIEGTDDSGKLPEGADDISGLEIIDDKTLQVTTKNPLDINYFSEFFGNNFIIAPEHVFSQYEPADIHTSEDAVNPSVTNGAYKFVTSVENDHVQLEANEEYYRGAPEIQNVYVRVLTGTAMVTELQSGGIDMAAGGGISVISHNDVPILEEAGHLIVDTLPTTGVQYVLANHQSERFADPVVRKALAHAINRDLAVDNLLLGNGEVTATPYTSVSDYKNDDLEPFPYDPEEATRLLEEANFDFDEPVTFIVPTGNAIREQMAELVQQDLVAIGIDVVMETYDFTTWISVAREAEYDLGIIGMSHYYDPNLQNYFATGSANNLGFYSSETMDRLIQEGNAGTSYEERLPIYEEIQELFIADMPAVPLYSEYDYKIQDERLNGGIADFWQASFADLHEWNFEE